MRRTLFLFLLTALLAFGVYRWLQLNHRLHATKHRTEQYTPADGPRIDPKDLQMLTALDEEYTELVQAVIPSVVSITTERRLPPQGPGLHDLLESLRNNRLPGPQDQVQTSLGSGVIVSREGHIITNHHVIAEKDKIEVQLTDGRVFPAQLIASDEQTDIAIVKINADKIEPLPLGDSDATRVGQMVFAVGNPFGLQESVTRGIISAKGRRAVQDSGVEFLQTDAAVNQGNSGGPLINLRGEIIGINSTIAASKQGAWIGISFAIPSNIAKHALESVLKTGRIVRNYLGVKMVDNTLEYARALSLPDAEGVIVYDVIVGSPAEKAGLQPGDVIRSVNGHPVHDKFMVRSRIAEAELHDKVPLTLIRDGHAQTATVEIEEAPPGLDTKPTPIP
jgi:Do/DeqQ family serine protease